VLVGFSAVIVGDEGGDYLDSKEAQVVELSNQASINYNHRCGIIYFRSSCAISEVLVSVGHFSSGRSTGC